MTVAYYVGGTGTGKTTLMMQHAYTQAAVRAVPLILLDSEGVVGPDKFQGETVPNIARLIDAVWKEGKHVRFLPKEAEEVEGLSRAVRSGGGCVLAIDEVSYWARGGSILDDLARLYRVHRHSGVDLYATSQYPADISPLIWNVKSEVYIFRNESSRAVERIREECSLPVEQIDSIPMLPDMTFIPWRSRGGNPLEK